MLVFPVEKITYGQAKSIGKFLVDTRSANFAADPVRSEKTVINDFSHGRRKTPELFATSSEPVPLKSALSL